MPDQPIPRSVYVGVDWGYREHQVCIVDEQGGKVAERSFEHTGEGLSDLVTWLRSFVAEVGQLKVAIERPHGPVVETLLEQGVATYAINPKQVDRFRDRFTVAGAKDDSRDAEVLASSLRTDPRAFQKLALGSPELVQLREYSRIAEELTEQQTGLCSKIRDQLYRYYPQFLQLGDINAEWRLALWELCKTPQQAQRIRRASIQQLFRKHRVRQVKPDQVLATLRARPLAVAAGTSEAAETRIKVYIAQLRLTHEQLRDAHRQIDACLESMARSGEEPEPGQLNEQHDVVILKSLPGVGRIILAVLLSEAHMLLGEADYHRLRLLAGVAPVSKSSGGNHKPHAGRGRPPLVTMRYACKIRLRNALWHWARCAVQKDESWKADYAQMRAPGIEHAAALRRIGDKLLRVACRMLRDRTLYDPTKRMVHAAPAA